MLAGEGKPLLLQSARRELQAALLPRTAQTPILPTLISAGSGSTLPRRCERCVVATSGEMPLIVAITTELVWLCKSSVAARAQV